MFEPGTCSTCGRDPSSPYRVYDKYGKVLQGCVDEIHTGQLVTPSESARWHNRTEAKAIRKALKDGRKHGGSFPRKRPR